MKKITLIIFVFFSAFWITKAQNVSTYVFAESTETYVPVNGVNSSAVGDDGLQNNISIGFTFRFGNNEYNTFSISTNGFIRLGNAIGNLSYQNMLSATSNHRPLIAPYWDDHNRNTGSIQYALTGIAPNRQLEIGWDSINLGTTGGANQINFASFKVRLYETSNQIDFVYGPVMNAAMLLSSSIGINDTESFLSVNPGENSTASSVFANNNISATTNVVGKKYTFLPPSPCNDTPEPGVIASGVTAACPDQLFTLSLQNPILESGITYQWQSSANGIDYTDINGGTFTNLTISQTRATYYKVLISCGTNTSESAPVEIGLNGFSDCYCLPVYRVGMTSGDLIANVSITGTTLANETGTLAQNPYYTFFTGQPNYTATLEAGIQYVMNIQTGQFADQNVAVWIDFNDDGVFSTTEAIGRSASLTNSGSLQLTIPCDAQPGLHRMRVRDVYDMDANLITPCDSFGYGETEDYEVTIIAATSCQKPSALAVLGITDVGASFNWINSCLETEFWDAHIAVAGSGLPAETPSDPLVLSGFTRSNLQPLTNYEFYVRANCGANGYSDWAGPFLFTTRPPRITNDECITATALTAGGNFEHHAVNASNIEATTSTNVRVPLCAATGFGGDVWFSAEVPEDGNLTVEVRPFLGSVVTDTGMAAYTGNCGSLTVLACDDESGVGSFSLINLTGQIPGATIYIRVWEYANDAFGPFMVSAWNSTLATNTFDASVFEAYPNPVKDFLTVSYRQTITNVEIYNLLGQRVFYDNKAFQKNTFDLSGLAKGAYIMKLQSGKENKSIKIIKE